MTRIVVTGAAGFVGVPLCRRLEANGHDVIRVIRRGVPDHPSVYVVDLAAVEDWREILRPGDIVVHLAARAHILDDRAHDPLSEYRRVNTLATTALAERAAAAGVRRLIFMSTIGVHGNETKDTRISVSDAPRPHSPYALSKYEGELALRRVSVATGLEFVVIRPPLVYGPNAPGNFRVLTRWLLRGLPLPFGSVTENRRSLVSIDNLVDLIVTCTDHPQAANQTFLVSDGEDISTASLLHRLGSALGVRPRLFAVPVVLLRMLALLTGRRDVAQRLLGSLTVDIRHTVDTLGWVPPVSVDEGLFRVGELQQR